MKKIVYQLFRSWIHTALTCYFAKIKVEGLNHLPSGKPIMFLANHQNALLDALLIATHCNRKPYFLTRSDVFKTSILKKLFELLRMIPIYRIRDGKDSLKGNTATFERCSVLLQRGETILIFPEGNHSLKRRVRPLSKGFTRILFLAMESNPSLEISIVPIGVNYANAVKFPDKAALYYGKEIKVQDFFDKEDVFGSVSGLKEEVYRQLKKLTTHIGEEEAYEDLIEKLEGAGVNYLNPEAVNLVLEKEAIPKITSKGKDLVIKQVSKILFIVLNFPIIFLWSQFIKPRITELEFLSTFRFMFVLLIYPLLGVLLMSVMLFFFNWPTILMIGTVHLILNIILVKLHG